MAGEANKVSPSYVHQQGLGTNIRLKKLTTFFRASNLRMKLLFNSHDREASEWPVLFAKADPRFEFIGVTVHSREPHNNSGAAMAMVEAIWEG